MEIKTKFNTGDRVIAITNKGFRWSSIKSIHVHAYTDEEIDLIYEIAPEGMLTTQTVGEYQLFEGKEDMIQFISQKL